MPILPSGGFASKETCEARSETRRNIANAILRQARERGIGDNLAKDLAAPLLAEAATYEEVLRK
ncbi:MAG: hypothetical protein ACPG4X_15420 [Pikeienuella sp.]